MKRVRKQTEGASKRSKPPRKNSPPANDQASAYPDSAATVRFGATIHAPSNAKPDWIEQLEIDRLPDPRGLVRALVTAADCVRLLDQGFEIRLYHAYPVQPLNPELIENDESFHRSLDKRLRKIKGYKNRKGLENL